jgi:hypothetical protein
METLGVNPLGQPDRGGTRFPGCWHHPCTGLSLASLRCVQEKHVESQLGLRPSLTMLFGGLSSLKSDWEQVSFIGLGRILVFTPNLA